MTPEQRLENAIKHLLRNHTPADIEAMAGSVAKRLHATLPKEQGGTVATLDGRARGRTHIMAKKVATGTLSVTKTKPHGDQER